MRISEQNKEVYNLKWCKLRINISLSVSFVHNYSLTFEDHQYLTYISIPDKNLSYMSKIKLFNQYPVVSLPLVNPMVDFFNTKNQPFIGGVNSMNPKDVFKNTITNYLIVCSIPDFDSGVNSRNSRILSGGTYNINTTLNKCPKTGV